MGNEIVRLIEDKELSLSLIFLKDYLCKDKIEYLKMINEDYSLDQDLFCSFFHTGNVSFKLFDVEDIGLVSFWEILLTIHLLKLDSFKTKINNFLTMFNFNGMVTNIAEVTFLSETLLTVLTKLFNIDIVSSQDQINSVRKEMSSYIKFIFEETNEINTNKVKDVLEKNEHLFNLLYTINDKARKLFEF